jgi:hypothetical protein
VLKVWKELRWGELEKRLDLTVNLLMFCDGFAFGAGVQYLIELRYVHCLWVNSRSLWES